MTRKCEKCGTETQTAYRLCSKCERERVIKRSTSLGKSAAAAHNIWAPRTQPPPPPVQRIILDGTVIKERPGDDIFMYTDGTKPPHGQPFDLARVAMFQLVGYTIVPTEEYDNLRARARAVSDEAERRPARAGGDGDNLFRSGPEPKLSPQQAALEAQLNETPSEREKRAALYEPTPEVRAAQQQCMQCIARVRGFI